MRVSKIRWHHEDGYLAKSWRGTARNMIHKAGGIIRPSINPRIWTVTYLGKRIGE